MFEIRKSPPKRKKGKKAKPPGANALHKKQIVLQRIKRFEVPLNVIPGAFRKNGIPGCVDVLCREAPLIEQGIFEAVQNGGELNCDWRRVLIGKCAERLSEIKQVHASQVADFRIKAEIALGLKPSGK